MISIGEKYIKLDTPYTSMIFCRYSELLEKVYYGKRISDMPDYDILTSHKRKYGHSSSDDVITANMTFSCYGMGCDREYSVELKNYDGGYANKFLFKSAAVVDKPVIDGMPSSYGGAETLELVYEDRDYNLELRQYFTVFDDTDVIAASTRLVNLSGKAVTVKSLMSCQLDLDESGYEIYSFTGAWARERFQQKNKLDCGVFSNNGKAGITSHAVNPFFMIKSPARVGGFYGFNLVYSGNHKEVINASPMNITRVMIGMNDFAAEKTVAPGGYFHTPEAVFVYGKDKNAVAINMHSFVNGHIIPARHKKDRPVAINIWSSLGFDFNREEVMEYAKKAEKFGMEMLIIDDGWFGNRNDDASSLGDWTECEKKTGGLKSLSEELHKIGLKFGIWIEPEMISPNSDLFRAHPEYVLRNPKREPILERNQLYLDLTNPEVMDFVYKSVENVIINYGADYVKWDCNRNVFDAYGLIGGADEDYCYRYVKNLYAVMDKLVKNYPDVLFEGCAAGGGRFDLGILSYMPQIWTSDNCCPVDRVYIQESTLLGYPQSAVSAHVGLAVSGALDRKTRLKDRFAVALEGVFGYECDITALSESEAEEVTRQVEFYKKNRHLLQYGKNYLVESAFDGFASSRVIVSEDKSRAIALIYKMVNPFNTEQNKYRFEGLDDDFVYRIKPYGSDKEFIAKGDVLNSYGLDFNNLFLREWKGEYYSEIHTLVLIIEKI